MVDLTPLHTFGLHAQARNLLVVDDISQLRAFDAEQYFILGEGSNTVFLEDYQGCVVQVRLTGVEVKERASFHEVTVGAGENWHKLVVSLLEAGIHGAENLALIPGTVGAAPIQNIGAYGRELADFCHQVECVDIRTGEMRWLDREQCLFGYRDSVFKQPDMASWLITQVVFRFPKEAKVQAEYGELKSLGTAPTPQQVFNKVVEVRQQKLPDPAKLGNAGSFFKNPVISHQHYLLLKDSWEDIPGFPVDESNTKIPAAWLIDKLGFKGKHVGGVACHANQPLVLVNQGGGTGEELLSLARRIRDEVLGRFSITLENEVRLLGAEGLVRL
ncbi:UDP-N-acetylmuramate dehydrogenase [Bowmanella sp. Y26]|uniref:UDP-N-acetylenolpyruvoylglucosamine reductase n=1 Tax=Bowmanella yangjiangensis TaxID=2811230 RepID=A0ABS3CZ47_9ALTE|nr:UDP-N-acetylmuramate dehydrogenase [Bowmanella yangjiangensis]MBN7822392.1 UDP-N-acetylmuramate dehydrogenase [Bowmanella yangjiangensis]MBT1061931.1 UDP-N-acetylmuramate dehydrogenase [Bowmanella yangjiangensis]